MRPSHGPPSDPVARPSERAPARRARRASRIAVLGLVLSSPALAWDSVSHGTVVAPHPEVAIRRGTNVAWCATIQIAWDRLADALGRTYLSIGLPADEVDVLHLNAGRFPLAALDPSTFVAVGGLARDDPVGRFQAELSRKFPDAEVGLPPSTSLPETRAVGLAYLRKTMGFGVPFPLVDDGLSFRVGRLPFLGRTRARAFGFPVPHRESAPTSLETVGDDRPRLLGTIDDRALAQVRLHWQDHPKHPREFVLELLPTTNDRILLARMEPEATLAETWRVVESRVTGDGSPLPPFDRFEVPCIDVGELRSGFPTLDQGVIEGTRDYVELTQWTKFRLDETGARLESFAIVTILQGGGSPPDYPSYVFDRPFLVALVERGAARPYFLLWIGNADLLVKP